MSTLIEETEDYLYLKRYVHNEPDSFSKWELDENGNTKYSEAIQEAEHYACYELLIYYTIDKRSGEVIEMRLA